MNRHQLEQQRYRRQAVMKRRIGEARIALPSDRQLLDDLRVAHRGMDAEVSRPGELIFGFDVGALGGDMSVVAARRELRTGFFRLEDIRFIDDSPMANPEDGDEPSTVPLAAMELVATHETLDAINRAILGAHQMSMVRWVDGSAQTVDDSEWRRPLFFSLDSFSPYGFAQDPDEQTDERGVPEELVRSLGGKVYEKPLIMRASGGGVMRFRRYTISEQAQPEVAVVPPWDPSVCKCPACVMARAAGHGGAVQ